LHAGLGKQDAGARLPDRHHVVARRQCWKPAPDLAGLEALEWQPVRLRAGACAAHPHAVFAPDHQTAGLAPQQSTTLLLELSPQLVGALDQRDVARILEVRLADDPGLAVRGPERVRWREAIEA